MSQRKPQDPIRKIHLRLRLRQHLTTRLQQLPILNTRGARQFARPTSETPVDMLPKRGRSLLQPPLGHRPHKINPPPRPIILIPRNHVRRARFETQPTMNAGQQLIFLFS